MTLNDLKDFLKEIRYRFLPLSEESSQSSTGSEEDLALDYSEEEIDFEGNRFLNSIEQLSEEDIPLSHTAVKQKENDLFRKILLVFFGTVFLVSCAFLVQSFVTKYRSNEIYNQLQEEFFSAGFNFDLAEASPAHDGEVSILDADKGTTALKTWTEIVEEKENGTGTTGEKKEYNEELEKMRAGLASLAKINPDIYGWITVEGTRISYPIVQGADNDFYLDHAYTGDYLPEGSIFADYRNHASVTDNYNTVFYGHNLTSGGMFHDMIKFARDDYMADKRIYVYTYEGVFIYEPFSFYESRYDYRYFRTNFADSEAFVSFAEEVQGNTASLKKNLTFTAEDRLLTLSTCTNGYYTQRYALHAKLVSIITD